MSNYNDDSFKVFDKEHPEEFKINNNWSSFYARKFMKESPAYEGFFRLRTQTSLGDES